MQFRLLGSLEVLGDDGKPIDLGGTQPRTVLAALLVACGNVVPVDSLVDVIWGESPPASAAGTLQSYISRLRRALEPGRSAGAAPKVLVSDPPGYRLDIDASDVDFRRFELLADEGRSLLDAGEPAGARERLLEAAGLWRGRALVEFADQEFASGVAARLEQRRLAALEDRLEADLRLGRHAAVIGELTELVAAEPLREGLWGHLALALYRAGRQAEALRAIDQARRTLRDELGIDPGRAIRDLESRILAHDPSLDLVAPAPGPAAAPAPTVTGGDGRDRRPARRFVGREHELAELLDAFDEVRQGRTRLALVEGDPGIGKTRLLEELASEAAAGGAFTAWGRCYEGGAAPSFWPWLGVLRSLVGSLPPERRDPVVTGGLGQLLGAGGAGDSAALRPGVPGSADPTRFQVFESVADLLVAVAARQPVLVLIDDLQWADQASLELVEFLAQRLHDAPVLLVGSLRELEMGRNDAVVAAAATVARQAGARRLRLRGLDEEGTGQLIEHAIGGRPTPRVLAAIHDRSEGNPFYVTELARLLASGKGGLEAVPAGVRDVVRRRLAQLPPETLELLAVAAVIGRDVELRLLTRASGLSVDRCLDDLDPALVTRLLLSVPDQPSTFRFSHALVREVVLDDVSPLRRARFSQRVADAILAVEGETDDNAEIVAAHLWAAVPLGLERRAAEALERGADVAIRRFAYEAADDQLDRAVQLRRSIAVEPADMEAELFAIGRLSAVRRSRFGYGAGVKTIPMDRAKELAARTGHGEAVAAMLWFEWAAAVTACDFATGLPLATQILEMGKASDDPVLRAIGHHCWGVQCWHLGRMVEAREHLDESLRSGAEEGMVAMLESGPLMRCFHLHVHELLGDIDDGGASFTELAEQQTAPLSRLIVHGFNAITAAIRGDVERCFAAATTSLAHDPDEVVEFFGGASQMYIGWAMSQMGQVQEGLELLQKGKRRFVATGARTVLAVQLANEATCLLRAGRPEEAQAAVAEAHALIESLGEKWQLPIVLLAEAEVRHAKGDDVTALVQRAREVAEEMSIVVLVRRAEETAARLGLSPKSRR